MKRNSRRKFIEGAVAAGALAGGAGALAQPAGNIRGFDHVALPMQNTDAMLAFYRGLGLQVCRECQRVFRLYRRPDDQFSSPGGVAARILHLACARRETAVRRLVLCVGRHAGVVESPAGSCGSQGHRRPRGAPGRPQEGRFQRLCARSGRQSAGVHDLLATGDSGRADPRSAQVPLDLLFR